MVFEIHRILLLFKPCFIDIFPKTWLGFESDQNNIQTLQKQLTLERSITAKAERARVEAEARCLLAERERDMYKHIVQRIQDRLHHVPRDHRPQGLYDSHVSVLHGILQGYSRPLDHDMDYVHEQMHNGIDDDYDDDDDDAHM